MSRVGVGRFFFNEFVKYHFVCTLKYVLKMKIAILYSKLINKESF